MSTDDRPSSFGQALETSGYDATADSSSVPDDPTPVGDGADGSSPSPDPSLASSDAAQTAATPTESPLAAEPPPGPLPYERHKAILDKAYAERDGLKAQMEQMAWAQQVPAEVGPRLVAMAQRVNGDPVGFLMELATEVQNDPRHAAALKSHAARLLGTRTQAAPPAVAQAEDQEPQPDIVVDGHSWYSGTQQGKRDQWMARQLAGQLSTVVQEQVGPLAALAQRVADAERQQVETKEAESWAASEFDRISKRPGFMENREAISAAFDAAVAQIPKAQQTPERLAVLVRDIYADIAIPGLPAASNKNLLQTLTAKAVTGSLGTRPTVAATATRPRSMVEALQQQNF